MSPLSQKTIDRAKEIPVRERRRLRRNYIMWEGRLERSLDSLQYEEEILAHPDEDWSTTPERVAGIREEVEECRRKLAKATKEIEDALGVSM